MQSAAQEAVGRPGRPLRLGYDDRAEYELDLRGLDLAHARESVARMLERARFRAPRSVIENSDLAKPFGSRTQPCEAGWFGTLPSCSAMPDHVSRCMKGMGAFE